MLAVHFPDELGFLAALEGEIHSFADRGGAAAGGDLDVTGDTDADLPGDTLTVSNITTSTIEFTVTDPGVVVRGLTIRNGRGQPGAGVYMTGGVVRDCVIRDNAMSEIVSSAYFDGGGLYFNSGGEAIGRSAVLSTTIDVDLGDGNDLLRVGAASGRLLAYGHNATWDDDFGTWIASRSRKTL